MKVNAKLVKAEPVVVPPPTVELTAEMTVEEAQKLMAVLGRFGSQAGLSGIYNVLANTLVRHVQTTDVYKIIVHESLWKGWELKKIDG